MEPGIPPVMPLEEQAPNKGSIVRMAHFRTEPEGWGPMQHIGSRMASLPKRSVNVGEIRLMGKGSQARFMLRPRADENGEGTSARGPPGSFNPDSAGFAVQVPTNNLPNPRINESTNRDHSQAFPSRD
jgi:hypothetical protein